MKQQEKEALLRRNLSIDGDGNIIGDNNTVSIAKLGSGDYYSIQIGELSIEHSREELEQILVPVRLTSRLMRLSLVASVVIILGVAVILYLQSRQFQKSRQMTGEFNVAVAEIVVVASDGKPLQSNDGKALAEFLTQRLETYFAEIDERTVRYQVWSPRDTGKITGKDSEKRSRSAESLAERINAHIVVYGAITSEDNRAQFTPEFFVNYKGFEQAQEATGAHQLGASMLVPLPFDKTKLQAVENPALAARVKGLSLMTVGLAYYSIDNFEQALDYFERAAETDGWVDTAGKEVVYLLEGNVYARMTSDENTTRYLQIAEDAYTQALKINPDYTRARLGLSDIVYLKSFSDPNAFSFETVNLERLADAEQLLLDILTIKDLPESVNYQAKINFRLGMIYMVRAQVLEEDWLEPSRARFGQVIEEYEEGNQQIVDIAGHAHAKLGLIEFLQNHPDEAIIHYKAAIEMVTPHYQAHYASLLGEIYLSTGKAELAIDAYQRAIQTSEFYGDEEGMNKYSQRLSEIESEAEK